MYTQKNFPLLQILAKVFDTIGETLSFQSAFKTKFLPLRKFQATGHTFEI